MSDQGGYGPGGTGGNYGDPQYPSDPNGGQYGQYGSGYGEQYGGEYANQYGQHAAPPAGGKNQRGIFIGLGAVVVAGLVVLVLAITGVFSSGSTPADGPKQVVEKVLFASKKQNLDDVKAVVCAKDLSDPELSDIVGKDHATSYQIGSVDQQSDERAEVDVRVTTSDNDTESAKLPVIKENGKWKVCFSDATDRSGSISPPLPSPTTDTPTPTPTTDDPTDEPTTSSGFCGTQATAADTAKTFISFITLSSASLADDCVYQGRITSAQIEALTGDIYSPTQNDGQPGPKFVYKSVQNDSTITLTVERESDGKYYVTAASKS